MTFADMNTEVWRPRPVARALCYARKGAQWASNSAAELRSLLSGKRAALDQERNAYGELLRELSTGQAEGGYRRALIDASWYNPNYWLRFAILRAALGLADATETAVVGPFKRRETLQMVSRLEIDNAIDFTTRFADENRIRKAAERLLAGTGKAEDILSWTLPERLPAKIVYDGILKRQRQATVDLGDPLLLDHVVEALRSIEAAARIVDETQPEVVLVSHTIEFRYGSLAWCALRRGIPVVVVTGYYGTPRYRRMTSTDDVWNGFNHPSRTDLCGLPADQLQELVDRGRRYLVQRMAGTTGDIGATYAFGAKASGTDRSAMCKAFRWDEGRPIVSVYASAWFDYPHHFGMSNFTDFADWIRTTVEVANTLTDVNWLFRPHPIDQWYGGLTLTDLLYDVPGSHVRICPREWNGAEVHHASDGLVTMHGTAGLEYAASGKPVLLADRGWYHEVGFATLAQNRKDYLQLLRDMTWLRTRGDGDLAAAYCGVYFCPPFEPIATTGDDSRQDRLLPSLIDLMQQREQLQREVQDTADWWRSDAPHFHTWRTLNALQSAQRPTERPR